MKSSDHLLLGRLLLRGEDGRALNAYERLFLLGCCVPDYNPLTYLRGSLRAAPLRGHNAENAQPYICASIRRLQSARSRGALWAFSLGTLMHYVADSFTFPHNRAFRGDLSAHIAYELGLHEEFERELRAHRFDAPPAATHDPLRLLALRHRLYLQAPAGRETDCAFIVGACRAVLTSLLTSTAPERIALPPARAEVL